MPKLSRLFLRNFPLDNFRFYLKNPEIFTVFFRGGFLLRKSKSKHCKLKGSNKRTCARAAIFPAIFLSPIFLALTTKVFKYPRSETAVTALTF